MAAVQWSGGKCHGAKEAKPSMMHDDKQMRLIHGHSNPDIDLTKTPLNFSYRGMTYAQKCERYDELMETVKVKRKSSGRNANTTLQKLNIPVPAALQDGDQYDMQTVRSWCHDVCGILEAEYGECFIDADTHVDEIHLYLDPRYPKDDPDRYRWSRVHIHASVVPAMWETVKDKEGHPVLDEDGKPKEELVLNGNNFSKKSRIKRLNQLIHDMTLERYGVQFMTGAGKGKSHQQVEDLKAMSAEEMRAEGLQLITDRAEIERARVEIQKQKDEAQQMLDEAKRETEEKSKKLKQKVDKIQQQLRKEYNDLQKKQTEQEKELQEWGDSLEDHARELDEREKDLDEQNREYQEWEESINARAKALDNRERDLDERENATAKAESAAVQKAAAMINAAEQVARNREITLDNMERDARAILEPYTTCQNTKKVLENMRGMYKPGKTRDAIATVLSQMDRLMSGDDYAHKVDRLTSGISTRWIRQLDDDVAKMESGRSFVEYGAKQVGLDLSTNVDQSNNMDKEIS